MNFIYSIWERCQDRTICTTQSFGLSVPKRRFSKGPSSPAWPFENRRTFPARPKTRSKSATRRPGIKFQIKVSQVVTQKAADGHANFSKIPDGTVGYMEFPRPKASLRPLANFDITPNCSSCGCHCHLACSLRVLVLLATTPSRPS